MLNRVFPFMAWFKGYTTAHLRIDAIAGLTVALVLIPQSMAYAQLAGLPAYYGLYASFLPPIVAALFGSSRQLATGPVAVVSLMTAACLEPLATAGSPGYITYAILLALMVGAFQFALGVLRLGLVVNFLSHPVVNGFANAAAIIIATSQLSKIVGVDVESSEYHFETVWRVILAAFHFTHWPTLFMGVGALALMFILKAVSPRIPYILVAVVLATAIAWLIGFEHNVKVNESAIASERAKTLIAEFNEATENIAAISQERTKAYKALNKAEEEGDMVGLFSAQRDGNVVDYNLQKQKDKQQNCRRQLRDMVFKAVEKPDGALLFYLAQEVPPGAATDGRRWRIIVGNNKLKTDAIKVMGGGAVVGEIPKGVPTFSAPKIDMRVIMDLMPFAIIISLLGFMEAISISKAIAAKTGRRLDPNQELIGQGLANLVGAMGQSYPISGSFSRSAVNLQAGAVSGLSSVFTGLIVVIVLYFFTPLLYHLPQAVLAAVIMMAVLGLINVSGFVHAWRVKWYDGAISVIAFLATLAFAPHLDKGITIGVVLSLLVFLYKSMRPRVVSLARAEDQALRCAETHGLKECELIAMVRFDGPLFFANVSYLEDKITKIMLSKKNLKHIILVCNGINDIDTSGEETLSLLIDRVRSAGLSISLSGVNEAVMKVLIRTHLPEKIGKEYIFSTMEKAIVKMHPLTHENSGENVCPLLTVCRTT